MKNFKKLLDKKVLTVSQLATKFKVPVEHIRRELFAGIKIEYEHTSSKAIARRIALAHIAEDPNYYKKLKKVERG